MSDARGTKGTVLVVEDDDDVRGIVVRALSQHYSVQSAVDGNAALSLLAAPPPDAIVCDVMMPGIDGFELARRIKATPSWSRVPILFLTARGSARDVAEGINAGARHYVVKPFKIADLLAKVERMLKSVGR